MLVPLVISAYREGTPIAQMALPSDHRAALALLSSALLGTAADVVALLLHRCEWCRLSGRESRRCVFVPVAVWQSKTVRFSNILLFYYCAFP